jgi:cation transport ATPase
VLLCTSGVDHLQHTKWIALAAVALKLPHIMLKAASALKHCTLDINTLMTIAVAGGPCLLTHNLLFLMLHKALHPCAMLRPQPSPCPALQKLGSHHGCVQMLRQAWFAGAIAIGQYTEAGVVVVLFCVAEHLERNCRCAGQD